MRPARRRAIAIFVAAAVWLVVMSVLMRVFKADIAPLSIWVRSAIHLMSFLPSVILAAKGFAVWGGPGTD